MALRTCETLAELLRLEFSGACDIGLRGRHDDVDRWSGNVQRICGDRSARSARRTRLLVDDDADSARQGNRKIWVTDKDRLPRDGQSH